MSKSINYLETFFFSDIPYFQPFPVYSVSESGHIYNIKSIMYPNPKSRKKFTRNKQLYKRSLQAKIFDSLINIGYFENLIVVKEFPIIIQNNLRLQGQTGGFYYLDYYFPQLSLDVELDSELHDDSKDAIRDQYLDLIGIKSFRIFNFDNPKVQSTRFKEFISLLKSSSILESPKIFDFLDNIRSFKNSETTLSSKLKLWKE